jgi:hypothetical protein
MIASQEAAAGAQRETFDVRRSPEVSGVVGADAVLCVRTLPVIGWIAGSVGLKPALRQSR